MARREFVSDNEKLMAEWHPIKNEEVKPSDITCGSAKKVWWICGEGHEWQASPDMRTNIKTGCPICGAANRPMTFQNTLFKVRGTLQSINPAVAAEWHPTKNGDLQPTDVTPNSGKVVWWTCKNGHEYQARIQSRNKGSGCMICYRQRKADIKKDIEKNDMEIS